MLELKLVPAPAGEIPLCMLDSGHAPLGWRRDEAEFRRVWNGWTPSIVAHRSFKTDYDHAPMVPFAGTLLWYPQVHVGLALDLTYESTPTYYAFGCHHEYRPVSATAYRCARCGHLADHDTSD